MAIQLDSAKFEILAKKYLDDRQYVETLDELNNVDSDIYPPGIITYCKETGFIYKRNNDDTWTKIDMDDVSPYLFISEDGIFDYEQPIYAHMEGNDIIKVKNNYILLEDLLNMENNNIVDNNTEEILDDNYMYSQRLIEQKIEKNYNDSIEYVRQSLLKIIKPNFEKVYDVSEMTESGTFYLLESVTNPGQFVMYIIDDRGKTQPMGSSNMALNDYQTIEDRTLKTDTKLIPNAINGLNTVVRKNLKNAGDLNDIGIQDHSDTLVDALNYNQLVINRIKNVDDLKTENKETIVKAINEVDKKHGDLKKLSTIYKNNFVVSLNSFYSANVPAGAIFPHTSHTPPPGYLLCDGAEYSMHQYPELFSAIGYNFGMGENSNFKVPKFDWFQSAIGYDPNDEDFANIGQTGGESIHCLTGDENPHHYHYIGNTSHNHAVSANDYYLSVSALQRNDNDILGESNGHREYRSDGNSYTYYNHRHSYTTSTDAHTHMCDTVGRGEGHTNMQPYFGLVFIIKY